MRLYHYTCLTHVEDILAEGRLRTTESNVGSPSPQFPPSGLHLGPDVVWLLDTPEAAHDHGLGRSPEGLAMTRAFGFTDEESDKTRVRFTLDLPSPFVTRWSKWAPAQRMNPDWRRTLVDRAGGAEAAKHWWVSTSPIPAKYWIEVRDLHTGDLLDLAEVGR